MANINLLPWRDEYRQEKKKEYLTILAGIAVIAIVAAFLWIQSVNSSIDHQAQRNQMLKTEIAKLEEQVTEIRELQKRKEDLIERMRVIQDLQGNRPLIVRVFDGLVRAVPDGVYLTSIKREGKILRLDGVAESNNRVSSLMRRLDESEWFENPNLLRVQKSDDADEDAEFVPNEFEMTISISTPKVDEGGA